VSMNDTVMVASHDHYLVALSVLISILGAYAACDLSDRVRDARGRFWLAWLLGAATVDGIGTWSMHYTGKLALRLPVPIVFDWRAVLLSLLLGILGSAAALFVLSHKKIGWARILIAGVFLGGIGISGLHYTSMAAMKVPEKHHYSPVLVVLSVVLAIVLCVAALLILFLFRQDPPDRRLRTYGGALTRGAANPVMHYTAMAGVTFAQSGEVPELPYAVGIASLGILGIAVVPVMVLVVALLTSLVDRIQRHRALLDELFESAPQAVVLMSADNRVVRVNREFTVFFGYTRREAVGRRLSDLIVPPESRDEERRYSDVVARGQRLDAEGVRQRKDGSRLHVSIVRVPVSLPGGQLVTYAIYRDITERKRAEQALRESADRLQALSRRLLEVQEDERRHVARELHDEVGQLLTGLGFMFQWSGELTSDAAKARFEQAGAIISELLEKVRALSFDLRPTLLDQLGLLPALQSLFERYTRLTGVAVHFKTSGLEHRVAPDVETAAYRIVQEALTNVARHAKVRDVTVRLWVEAGTLTVQIEDEGVGFDPDTILAPGRSSGIPGMRERAMLVGGRLVVDSTPGGGTHLSAELPIGRLP
jgi:PAS domain S-box-containing protein